MRNITIKLDVYHIARAFYLLCIVGRGSTAAAIRAAHERSIGAFLPTLAYKGKIVCGESVDYEAEAIKILRAE
jgi:hypothetical protein